MSAITNGDDSADLEHEPHFEPIIYLPEIVVNAFEDDEIILTEQRAKLFRHDKIDNEWKERGTGDVKLLYNEKLKTARVVMRREKTLKICANHYVTQEMDLKPNCGSDRAWVWTTGADISDGEPRPEVLAIRFQNSTVAKKWKDTFEEAKSMISDFKISTCVSSSTSDVSESENENSSDEANVSDVNDEVVKQVDALTIKSDEKDDDEKPVIENKEIKTAIEIKDIKPEIENQEIKSEIEIKDKMSVLDNKEKEKISS